MKIHHHICQRPNVGDDINLWFWKWWLGDVLAYQPETLLVGIGTVLNDKLPHAERYLVIGSGAGYGNITIDNRWQVACVRGPLTAKILGLSKTLSITDPGALIPLIKKPDELPSARSGIAFMPHIGIDSPNYRDLVESLGWRYISPSDDQNTLFSAIAGADRLITSSLHGAIFADAYRTPWLGVSTSPEILPFKWQDWGLSLSLDISLTSLPPLWPGEVDGIRSFASHTIKRHLLRQQLRKLAIKGRFSLSTDSVLRAKQDALQHCLAFTREQLIQEAMCEQH
ncbi:polysaccharide pyruvyl transferase family protein [Parasalinivibrio latis]|uniref:polysaccharide pyruvyl transferase family protein n=1 Tax=Parasalinivibrio latis TaxID=2952610 RepID=UPI0030E1EB2E